MRIVCVGGGPAGLYLATLIKLRNKEHEVKVIERNYPGVTYGWGVVFWDGMLDILYASDPPSAREIRESSVVWDDQEVHIRGKPPIRLGGYGFSMGRKCLIDILAKRAMHLGAEVQFGREVKELSELADADLIVACDGVNSRVRQLHAHHFGADTELGRNKYIWLGTNKVFDAFTFAFEETDAGWIWFHAYRFDSDTSTCIVECSPETWKGLGFDQLDPGASISLLQKIFEPYLDGHSLINQLSHVDKLPWLNFARVSNETWYHGNVVLMGDAAHTTHFTIGSGTKLAIGDAIGLADKLHAHEDLRAALEAYQQERRAALLTLEGDARNSALWFENVRRHIDQEAAPFAYSLLYRRQSEKFAKKVPWHHLPYLPTQVIAALRKVRRMSRRRFRSVRRELRAYR